MRSIARTIVALAAVAAVSAGAQSGSKHPSGNQLFYRMLGAETNAPLLPVTRTICAVDGGAITASTGMALSGFTEYPGCSGRLSYTFAENHTYFPRIASGLVIDPARINTGDIVVDHVYEPDGCVWGPPGREFVQTFVATGRELVSATILVASEPGLFHAALLEGGPEGKQIGPSRTFRSGHSMEWGTARWKAAAAPLVPGQTYAIRFWREDGKPWTPYLHSTGDAYDGGILYVDGTPRPESDLAAWIIEEPPELSRAIIEGADDDGWVYATTGTVFIPRTPNVRLISVAISPVAEKVSDVVMVVRSADGKRAIVAGPKRCLVAGRENGERRAYFLFGAEEFPVEKGRRYRIELFNIPHRGKMPDPDSVRLVPCDVQARVYGEPVPGALPAIGNLAARFENKTSLHLSWQASFPCPIRVEISRVRSSDKKVFDLDYGANELVIPELWPGHDYDFRLTALGPTGLRWKTPLFRVRVPGGPHPPPPPYLYPDHPKEFVKLAPPPLPEPPDWGVLRFSARLPLSNSDFEQGLEGWQTEPAGIVYAAGKEYAISPYAGSKMAGWSKLAGKKRDQVFEQSTLYRKIPTIPGHRYLLSARLNTSVENGPRGDTRIRLFADPAGGRDFGGLNSSQWYWTDGRWLRFQHCWTAAAEQSTIGFGFFRWRDLDRASAYVDHVLVLDLGPARKTPADPPARARALPCLVLADPRIEADDRVEAQVSAPPGYVITGVGARAAGDNVTTIWIQIRPLLADGTLGPAEEMLSGWEPDAGLEAQIALPDGYVATGFGARIAPEWDVKTLAVWGRPLLPDGTLGEEKEFRAGVEPKGGLEKRVNLEHGRVLLSVGLRCAFNDVAGISARSAALRPTATARVSTGAPARP